MSCVTCHMSHDTCQVSHVTCYMSCVTCHVSNLIFHIFVSGAAYRWRVCYQSGLPRLVLLPTPKCSYRL